MHTMNENDTTKNRETSDDARLAKGLPNWDEIDEVQEHPAMAEALNQSLRAWATEHERNGGNMMANLGMQIRIAFIEGASISQVGVLLYSMGLTLMSKAWHEDDFIPEPDTEIQASAHTPIGEMPWNADFVRLDESNTSSMDLAQMIGDPNMPEEVQAALRQILGQSQGDSDNPTSRS